MDNESRDMSKDKEQITTSTRNTNLPEDGKPVA
jgi:hypothetical protein